MEIWVLPVSYLRIELWEQKHVFKIVERERDREREGERAKELGRDRQRDTYRDR